jgi:hypothetical protein
MLHSPVTCDYVITGGNDKRIRYWSLNDPSKRSYLINSPLNEECHYQSEFVGGGMLVIKEQILKNRMFPTIDANLLNDVSQTSQKKPTDKLTIPGTCIELSGDSAYFGVLSKIIQQNFQE